MQNLMKIPGWNGYCSSEKRYVREPRLKGYDSMCLSAYENALELAVEFGWIKKEEVLR